MPEMNTEKQEITTLRYLQHVSKNMGKLTLEQFPKIINIIREQEPHLQVSPDDDMEVDFGRLKYSTVQKLNAYAKSCQ